MTGSQIRGGSAPQIIYGRIHERRRILGVVNSQALVFLYEQEIPDRPG